MTISKSCIDFEWSRLAICQIWAGNRQRTDYWTEDIAARGSNLTGRIFLRSFPFKDGQLAARVTDALAKMGLS